MQDGREGSVDPWSGQRPAFPLDHEASDPEDRRVLEYMLGVRHEARTLALSSIELKRPARARPVPQSDQLDYSSSELPLGEILRVTQRLFNADLEISLAGGDKLAQIYEQAYAIYSKLEPEHPEQCQTLATWKAWTASNAPVPVSHLDTFRLYKYLVRWCSAQPPEIHFTWAWSLLLRTPTVLSGDEMSTLRDLCRSLAKHEDVALAKAFIRVVATSFGQKDLLARD